MNTTHTAKTHRLTGLDAIDYADERGVTLTKHADPTEGAREGLTVEEALAVAARDPSLVYVDIELQRCECGEWSGEACSGEIGADAVTVHYVPGQDRDTVRTLGGIGTLGTEVYATRIRVTPECADLMSETDGDWCWRD